jgi:opacity protein-like surface antigen
MKNIIALSALFAASAAFAGGPEIVMMPESPFNGFYLGGDGGFHHTGFETTSNVNFVNNITAAPILVPFSVTLATQSGGDTSTDGYYGVRGGWGKVFMNRWYGGIEGFADFGNADGSTTTTVAPNFRGGASITNSAHVGNDWGVDGKLGILLSPTTLAYAKLGAEWADVKSSISSTNFNSNNNPFFNSSNSDTQSGFLWGFGVEQFIWKNMVSLFGEFTYVSLGSESTTASFNLIPSNLVPRLPAGSFFGFQATNSVTPDISSFTGGLNFHFGQNWL